MDFKEIYESFEREHRIDKIADEQDVKDYMGIETIGEKFSILPPPETREEALEWLEKYYGAKQADFLVREFKSKFPVELRPLQDQLKKINQFIVETDKLNSIDAVDSTKINKDNKDHYEYLKWKCGHYKVTQFYSAHSFISSDLILVYGKYVLYKKWLEEQIRDLTPKNHPINEAVQEHKNSLKFHESINPKREITIYERIKRELITIYWIYISQLTKFKKGVDNLINEDGRICWTISIRSDRQLKQIEDYKQHYIDRFEKANTQVVVKKELIEIYRLVQNNISLYEQSISSPLEELFNSYNRNPVLKIEEEAYRTMIILVVDYQPQNILFGYDVNTNEQRTIFTIRDYNYVLRNDEVIEFCWDLINFINTFEIPELQAKDYTEIMALKDKLTVNIKDDFNLPESLDDKQLPKTKITHPIHDPNFWSEDCYELFKYLFDNYYNNGTKRQLLNIWFFLKQHTDTKNSIYATKEKYKEFIVKHYQIKITNKAIPDNWFEIEFPKIKGFYSLYNS
jgi:hypothetical protein